MFNKKILSLDKTFYVCKNTLTDYNVVPVRAVPINYLKEELIPAYALQPFHSLKAYSTKHNSSKDLPALEIFKKHGTISFFIIKASDYLSNNSILSVYGYNNFTIENKQPQIYINCCYSLPKLNFWQRNIFTNHYYKGTLEITTILASALYFEMNFDKYGTDSFPAITAKTNFKYLDKYLKLGYTKGKSHPTEHSDEAQPLYVELTKSLTKQYYKGN